MAEQKNKSVGGLYAKTSKGGKRYLSGFINLNGERVNIVVFKNEEKFSEKTPDFSILLSEGSSGQSGQAHQPKPVNKPKSKPDFDDDETIPF